MQTLFSSTLTLIGIAVILVMLDPALALVTFLTFPLLLDRQRDLPRGLLGRLPAHARADRHGHRVPAGDAVRRARCARLRAGAAPQDPLRGAQRRAPRGEHAHRLPERRLLPGGRAPVRRGHGGDPDLRRQPGGGRRGVDRRARDLRLLPPELLRPDPVAVAALHHLPVGHGGARQDLRAAGRGARDPRPARCARAAPAARGHRVRRGHVLLRRGRAGALRRVHPRAAGPDRGAGGRHRRRQVHAREARGPLLRPRPRAACWWTATTCAA